MSGKNKGVVLIVVLAVLTILSMIGIMLIRLSTIERTTSRAYSDLIQAKMLAESGVFHGLTNIRSFLAEKGFKADEYFYYGEDLNTNNSLDTGEDLNKNNKLDTNACPLKWAVRPSLMTDLDNNGSIDQGDLIEIRGRKIGVSGMMNQTDGKKNFFTLRIDDLSNRIFVNMSDHPHLQIILENLAEEVGLNRDVGTRVYQNRGTGYFSLSEIEGKAKLSEDEFNKIRPFLTVYSWLDKNVLEAVSPADRMGKPELNMPIYSWETVRTPYMDYPRDYSKDAYTGQITGRPPVNINTAPKEVLVALIRNLKGFYLDEGATIIPMVSAYGMMTVNYTYVGSSGQSGTLGRIMETTEIDKVLAGKIADSIIANRLIKEEEKESDWEGVFNSWQQFHQFCDNVLWQGKGRAPYKGIINSQQADVFKANFNPNSNINDFNPSYQRMLWVDKTDLTFFTTEFSFFPSGYFSIDSIGRVLDKHNKLLAEAEINTVVKLFDIYRETSQSDFLHEYAIGNDPIGSIISENNGVFDSANNLSLQTYPEILDKSYVKDATYEGYISLATIEHKFNDAAFAVHYSDQGLNAENPNQKLVKDLKGPYTNRLAWNTKEYPKDWCPGKLFPDGVYSEIDSVPMYNYRPRSLDSIVVSMWIKPHFFPESAAKVRTYFTYQSNQWDSWYKRWITYPFGIYSIANTYGSGLYGSAAWGNDAWYRYPSNVENSSRDGYSYCEPWDNASFMAGGCSASLRNIESGYNYWGGGAGTPCLNHIGHGHEGTYINGFWGTYFRAGKWLHLGWIHIPAQKKGGYTESTGEGINDILFINGQKCGGIFTTGEFDASKANYYIQQNILRFGEKKNSPSLNTAPDSTIDEVLVWENLTEETGEKLIMDIWKEGRYYKENDAVFTSQPISLAKEAGLPEESSVTFLMAYWTQYCPETLPKNATCEINIIDENGNVIHDSEYLTNPAGSMIKATDNSLLQIAHPIRYKVYFRPQTTINDVVIDPLIFDDITLVYYGAPKFLSWSFVP
jgi:hypothetical protein